MRETKEDCIRRVFPLISEDWQGYLEGLVWAMNCFQTADSAAYEWVYKKETSGGEENRKLDANRRARNVL